MFPISKSSLETVLCSLSPPIRLLLSLEDFSAILKFFDYRFVLCSLWPFVCSYWDFTHWWYHLGCLSLPCSSVCFEKVETIPFVLVKPAFPPHLSSLGGLISDPPLPFGANKRYPLPGLHCWRNAAPQLAWTQLAQGWHGGRRMIYTLTPCSLL